jgi:hypothetical protein
MHQYHGQHVSRRGRARRGRFTLAWLGTLVLLAAAAAVVVVAAYRGRRGRPVTAARTGAGTTPAGRPRHMNSLPGVPGDVRTGLRRSRPCARRARWAHRRAPVPRTVQQSAALSRCAAKGTGQAGAGVAQGQDGSGSPLALGHKTNTRSHRAATVTGRQTPRPSLAV